MNLQRSNRSSARTLTSNSGAENNAEGEGKAVAVVAEQFTFERAARAAVKSVCVLDNGSGP